MLYASTRHPGCTSEAIGIFIFLGSISLALLSLSKFGRIAVTSHAGAKGQATDRRALPTTQTSAIGG